MASVQEVQWWRPELRHNLSGEPPTRSTAPRLSSSSRRHTLHPRLPLHDSLLPHRPPTPLPQHSSPTVITLLSRPPLGLPQ